MITAVTKLQGHMLHHGVISWGFRVEVADVSSSGSVITSHGNDYASLPNIFPRGNTLDPLELLRR